jgi:hypothetical protein
MRAEDVGRKKTALRYVWFLVNIVPFLRDFVVRAGDIAIVNAGAHIGHADCYLRA